MSDDTTTNLERLLQRLFSAEAPATLSELSRLFNEVGTLRQEQLIPSVWFLATVRDATTDTMVRLACQNLINVLRIRAVELHQIFNDPARPMGQYELETRFQSAFTTVDGTAARADWKQPPRAARPVGPQPSPRQKLPVYGGQ